MDTNQLKAKLEEELKQVKDSLAKVADPDVGDHVPGEYAAKFPNYGDDHDTELLENSPTEVDDYSTNLSVTETLEKRLNSINDALKRMEDGTYGKCSKCGKDINPKRLEVNPGAESCVECA